MAIYQLPKEPIFPHPNEAEPNGLLAIGGDLSPQRLIAAYATGIFPWYSHPDPILWWSPNPSLVLFPEKFKVTKSLKQALNSKKYQITCDRDFKNVIENCQKVPRPGQPGTWITPEIKKAYIKLHELGLAHSIETWSQGKLVGGLYGISLGKTFFGESMFYKMTDASKVAFYYLTLLSIDWEFPFIDCQVTNPHLLSLGAEEIPRDDFLDLLHAALLDETRQGKWEIGFQR